jgi:hypothetical protein
MNALNGTMQYFLMKKMTFEIWGLREAEYGNAKAIQMGFKTRNVPAVDDTFSREMQQNEFKNPILEHDSMWKKQYENTFEWRADNSIWWDTYDAWEEGNEDAPFPPKDRDNDDQDYVGFPLMQFVPATTEQLKKQQSSSSSSSSAPPKCKICGGELQRVDDVETKEGEQLNICRICGDTTPIIKGGKRKKTKRRKKRRKKTHKKKKRRKTKRSRKSRKKRKSRRRKRK